MARAAPTRSVLPFARGEQGPTARGVGQVLVGGLLDARPGADGAGLRAETEETLAALLDQFVAEFRASHAKGLGGLLQRFDEIASGEFSGSRGHRLLLLPRPPPPDSSGA